MSNRKVWLQERRARQQELPFWKRGLYLPIGVLVVVALLAGGIYLAVTGGDEEAQEPPLEATGTAADESATTETVAPPETAQATAAPPAAAGEGCDTPASSSGDDALSTPPEVQWSPVGNVAAATSGTDGPAVTEGPRRCFAQSAAGALLAAHNFLADVNNGQIGLAAIVDSRVQPGTPAHEAGLADAAAQGGSYGTTTITPVAYRFLEASDDRYTVALVNQVAGASDSSLVESRMVWVWVDEDWKLTESPEPQVLSEVPAGYLPWGPVADATE